MSNEHKVQCNICKEVFRPVKSHIRLICTKCFEERPPDATGKELIGDFIDVLYSLHKHATHDKSPFANLAWVKNAIKSEIVKYEELRKK